MAKKLIDQDEAARALGITLESLNSLRDRGKLYPKRDGGVWKYDQEDIERYQREMNEGSGLGQSWESISLDDISLEDNPDSVLLSEAELGESTTGKSTIIGRNKNTDAGASDIRLAGDSDLKLKSESASGTKPGLPTTAGSSDLNLLSSDDDAPLNLAGDSKISFSDDLAASGSDASKAGSSGLFDDAEFNLEPLGSSLSGALGSGKSQTPNSSGSFKLDDADLLGDSGSDKGRDKSGDTAKGTGSSLQLDDGNDELVLDGGHGSDITMSAADSGIMLVDPADSGLSLDSPMTLGGGDGDELMIGEDDMITLEEQVDVEGATQLRTSEDFALTPTMGGDDDSDSGSQVIALDSEDDMSGAGMFGSASSDSLLAEDAGFGVPMDGGMGGGVGLAGAPVAMQVAAYPEAPYSVWNVIGLICCTLLLMTGGIMVYDLTMQIWSWDQPQNYNSVIMDSLLGMFEG
jgi:hypothetical protein